MAITTTMITRSAKLAKLAGKLLGILARRYLDRRSPRPTGVTLGRPGGRSSPLQPGEGSCLASSLASLASVASPPCQPARQLVSLFFVAV